MNIKQLIIILLLIIFQSCKNNKSRIEIEQKDSIELSNKIRTDSITRIEEKIAIGNINFGIKKVEYIKEKKKFINKTNSKLGRFEFTMRPDFYDDYRGLRHLRLYGKKRNSDYHSKHMLDDYNNLKLILTKKHGKPTENYIYKNSPNAKWIIGNKTVSLSIIGIDNEYIMQLYFISQTIEE